MANANNDVRIGSILSDALRVEALLCSQKGQEAKANRLIAQAERMEHLRRVFRREIDVPKSPLRDVQATITPKPKKKVKAKKVVPVNVKKLVSLAAHFNSRRENGRAPMPANQAVLLSRKTSPRTKGVTREFFPTRALWRAHLMRQEEQRTAEIARLMAAAHVTTMVQ